MKATQLLKKDHAAVKKLMTAFGRTAATAPRRRQQLIDKIATELEIHSTIEEEIFYPAVKRSSGGARLVSEAETEHKKVEHLVSEAQGLDPGSDEIAAKVKTLHDAVLHHATEEEREMFPLAEETLRDELNELGNELAARKRTLARSRLQRAKRAVKKGIRKVA
jgi:hemerythrin superfamily protein